MEKRERVVKQIENNSWNVFFLIGKQKAVIYNWKKKILLLILEIFFITFYFFFWFEFSFQKLQ